MIVCKVCGATNEQGATFCGTCGSFLEWTGESVQPDGSTKPQGPPDGPPPGPEGQQPGAAGVVGAGAGAGGAGDETTAITTAAPVPTDPAPPGSIVCPNCGQANDPTRVYCSRCATELASAAAVTDPVVAAPPTSGGIPPVAILGAVGAIAVLGVLAIVFLLPKGGPAPSSEANVTEVPSASVASAPPSVEASSVAPSGDVGSASPSAEPTTPPPPVATGQIVFTAVKDGNADLMTWSADTGEIDPFVKGKGNQFDAAWSPDGSMVVYIDSIGPHSPNGGTPDEGLRIVNDDGSEADIFDFTHHDVDMNASWSPDGDAIAFSSTRNHTQNKNLDIWSRAFEATTEEKLLVDDAADDWDPAWSADGNRIAFVSERNGDARLFTMKPNGSDETPLKLGSGIFDDPAFSPDGKHLAFTRRDNSNAAKQLFVADADGGDMQQIGEFDASVGDAAWSPDSKLIALTRGSVGAMIVIVDATTGAQIDEFGVDGATNVQPAWK